MRLGYGVHRAVWDMTRPVRNIEPAKPYVDHSSEYMSLLPKATVAPREKFDFTNKADSPLAAGFKAVVRMFT